MTVSCPSCGDEYQAIGQHWTMACDHPTISERKYEILTGLLMGDSSVPRDNGNPRMVLSMITEPFVKWVSEELGWLSASVVQANRDSTSGKSVYTVRTRRHPGLERYEGWYSSGSKKFPENLSLTRLVAKVWYCCDGSLNKYENYNRGDARPVAVIHSDNEKERAKYLTQLFEDVGIESKFYRGKGGVLSFGVDGTEQFFEWIGEPLPGFAYKWPEKYK